MFFRLLYSLSFLLVYIYIQGHSVKDFSIEGIVKLTKPPKEETARDKILTEFIGYWQTRLMTLELYGLNGKDEWARMRNKNKGKVILSIDTIRKKFLSIITMYGMSNKYYHIASLLPPFLTTFPSRKSMVSLNIYAVLFPI